VVYVARLVNSWLSRHLPLSRLRESLNTCYARALNEFESMYGIGAHNSLSIDCRLLLCDYHSSRGLQTCCGWCAAFRVVAGSWSGAMTRRRESNKGRQSTDTVVAQLHGLHKEFPRSDE